MSKIKGIRPMTAIQHRRGRFLDFIGNKTTVKFDDLQAIDNSPQFICELMHKLAYRKSTVGSNIVFSKDSRLPTFAITGK